MSCYAILKSDNLGKRGLRYFAGQRVRARLRYAYYIYAVENRLDKTMYEHNSCLDNFGTYLLKIYHIELRSIVVGSNLFIIYTNLYFVTTKCGALTESQ